jgi:D-alanyl-D-alanine carboxypeptidase
MRSARSWAVLLSIAMWGGSSFSSAAGDEGALQGLLRHPALRGAKISVLVSELESGRVVLERDSRRSMIPASNQKLFVAAAALNYWGPAHRF